MHQAILRNHADRIESIRRFLPSNYAAYTFVGDVVIVGEDVAGWTMRDYVIPRLNSGNYYPELVC